MPAPILIGRTIPPAGLTVDLGRMIDYLWLKNKDAVVGVVVNFNRVPLSLTDGFFIRPSSGLDIAGINIRYVYLQSAAHFSPPPYTNTPDVDIIGVNMVLGSLDESRGGSARAATLYPFFIQKTESVAARRRSQSLIPRRSVYCDWITNSMGGDAGSGPPGSY
jgi:hypothetical protein